jgi:hypothetical protein
MVSRILASLLTLTMPVQGLAVPHSHGVMGEAVPEGHDQRPHIHVGGHHHDYGHSHGHGHSYHPRSASGHGEDQRVAASGTPDRPAQSDSHDDDAFYVSGELGLNLTRGHAPVASMGDMVLWAETEFPTSVNVRSPANTVARSPAGGDVPIFLTTLSLRL